MILGIEDILISWFVIILALLGVASLFVCCMIHCKKHLRLSDANKRTYLLTYSLSYFSLYLSCNQRIYNILLIGLWLQLTLCVHSWSIDHTARSRDVNNMGVDDEAWYCVMCSSLFHVCTLESCSIRCCCVCGKCCHSNSHNARVIVFKLVISTYMKCCKHDSVEKNSRRFCMWSVTVIGPRLKIYPKRLA